MSGRITMIGELVARTLAAFRHAGGTRKDCILAAFQPAPDQRNFAAGDEVTCACGSIGGVIRSIAVEDALICRTCRGRSVVPVHELPHVEHES